MLPALLTISLFFAPLDGEGREEIIQGFATESFNARQSWSAYASMRLLFQPDASALTFFRTVTMGHDDAEVSYRCGLLAPLLWEWRPTHVSAVLFYNCPPGVSSEVWFRAWSRHYGESGCDTVQLGSLIAEEMLAAGYTRGEIANALR